MSDDAFEDAFGEMVKDEGVTPAPKKEESDDVDLGDESKDDTGSEDEDEGGGEDESGDTGGADTDTVPKKALLAEQRRRQEERDENARLKEDMARLQGQLDVLNKDGDETGDENEADFYTDPEGTLQRMQQQIDEAKETASNAELKALARISAAHARRNHDDFDDTIKAYSEIVKENPALANKVANSDDPAETAYQLTKNYQLQQNPETYRESLADELLSDPEFLAKVKAKLLGDDAPASDKSKDKTPTNLAAQRSLGDPSSNDAERTVTDEDFEKLFAS